MDDPIDHVARYAKLSGDCQSAICARVVLVSSPYCNDLFVGEFCCCIGFTFAIGCASFFVHVLRVLRCSPKMQVIRVYAGRYVALMHHHHAIWYPPFMNGVDHTVKALHLSLETNNTISKR